MVKKISVFVMILGLVFLGVPQFNVKAQSQDYDDGFNDGIQSLVYYDYLNYLYLNIVDFGESFDFTILSEFDINALGISILFNDNTEWTVLNMNSNNEQFQFEHDGAYLISISSWVMSSIEHLYDLTDIVRIEIYSNDGFNFLVEIRDFTYIDDYNDTFIVNNYYGEIPLSFLWSYNNEVLQFNLSLVRNQGYNRGYDDGYDDGLEVSYDIGYDAGYDEGNQVGYWQGLNETDATGFGSLLSAVFSGLGALLAIEILPGVYVGAIIAVPLVFGIISFIVNKKKGDE